MTLNTFGVSDWKNGVAGSYPPDVMKMGKEKG